MDIAVLTALIRVAAKAAFGRLFYVPFMAGRCLLIEAAAPVGPCGADSWGNPSIAAMKSAQRLWNGRVGFFMAVIRGIIIWPLVNLGGLRALRTVLVRMFSRA